MRAVYDIEYDNIDYICSYLLARLCLPNEINYKLNTLSKKFNIKLNHYNALSDVMACGLLLNEMLKIDKVENLQEYLVKYNYIKLGNLNNSGFY